MALLLKLTQKLAKGFQAFWDRYPRRDAKKDASRAWDKLNPSPELEEEIHQALDWQVPMYEQRERQFIPLPATWIRGERWTDEKPPTTTPNRPIVKNVPLTPRQLADADRYREQQKKTQEAIRLMTEEGLTREEAMARAFGPKA